jgi:hypothetical protein
MKKLLFLTSLVLIIAVNGLSQTPCKLYTEPAGKFSYCPPDGWVSQESVSGDGFKVWSTPGGSAVIANFKLSQEATSMSHNDYMAAALKILLGADPAEPAKLVSWTSFTTDSHLAGSRIAHERSYTGLFLLTIQYILDVPGKKLILTFAVREPDKATIGPIAEAVAKSLKVL